MTDVAAVRIKNIVSVAQGASTYKGVREVQVQTNKGSLMAIMAEGDLYASDSENMGVSEDFPIQTSMTFEGDQGTMLQALGEAKGDLVITYRGRDGAGNKEVTILNHEFRRTGYSQRLNTFGQPTLEGVAHADPLTPDTLPISSADVA